MWTEGHSRERPAFEPDVPFNEPVEPQPADESRAEDEAHETSTHLEEAPPAIEIAPDERGEPDPRRDD